MAPGDAMSDSAKIAILGVFVADVAFRADRQPEIGETLLGREFRLGPGGKGSNQAVAAARLGAEVSFITRLGKDMFADMAHALWKAEGVTPLVSENVEAATGSAYIFIEDETGDNAIIICPGAAGTISPETVEAAKGAIADASVFVTQLEQPLDAAQRGLEIARAAGTATILNPAPAASLDDAMLNLCDYLTPNETEAADLTGMEVASLDEARKAGDALLVRGVGTALLTLGENGALLHGRGVSEHIPAFTAGPVVETTGAGDAFNGGFAVGLARGMTPLEAARFGNATAAISVTRPGTAPSMPALAEVEALLRG